jgi:HSP20 family protein
MSTALAPQSPRTPSLFSMPFRALRDEFDELFNRLTLDRNGDKWLTTEFSPACDISETDDAYQVRMDVPGIKPDDITVQVTGDTVHVSGERQEEKEEKGKTYHRVERRSGSFSQTLRLPASVAEDKVQAEFDKGVLTVTLPKTEVSKTRTVKVLEETKP